MKNSISRVLRLEPLDSRVLLACASFISYGESSEFTGNVNDASACLDVDLDPGDILNVRLDAASVDASGGSVVELVDSAGTRLIGSPTPWANNNDREQELPASSQILHGGKAAVVYHANSSGTFTVRPIQAAITGTGAFTLKVKRLRPQIEAKPNGSRQYIYLNFHGACSDQTACLHPPVDFSNFSQPDSSANFTSIDAYLDRHGRGYITAADRNAFIAKTVSYLETQFPMLAGRVLDSRAHSRAWDDPSVMRVLVGDYENVAFGAEAEYGDPGNFELHDHAAVPTSWGDNGDPIGGMDRVDLVTLCTEPGSPLLCQTGFEGETYNNNRDAMFGLLSQFIGRIIAHEVGHNLGADHAVTTPIDLAQARAVMMPSAITNATSGLSQNTFVGKTDPLDLKYGSDSGLLLQGTVILDEFHYLGDNEQRDRVARALAETGKATGLWLSYKAATLDGVSIQADELVYTGTEGADNVTVVSTDATASVEVFVNGVSQGIFPVVSRFRFIGNGGNDSLDATNSVPSVIAYGGSGNDTLKGGLGADVLYGGDGNDQLYGRNGNDSIKGDAGNDTIWGEGGQDTVEGGTGVDVFYMDDNVVDYILAEDGEADMGDIDINEGLNDVVFDDPADWFW